MCPVPCALCALCASVVDINKSSLSNCKGEQSQPYFSFATVTVINKSFHLVCVWGGGACKKFAPLLICWSVWRPLSSFLSPMTASFSFVNAVFAINSSSWCRQKLCISFYSRLIDLIFDLKAGSAFNMTKEHCFTYICIHILVICILACICIFICIRFYSSLIYRLSL